MPQPILTATPTEDAFFRRTNTTKTGATVRTRKFFPNDYARFLDDLQTARNAAAQRQAYYTDRRAGVVAKAYTNKWSATTARYGIWTTPDGTIYFVMDRVRLSGGGAPCAYPDGVRQYNADFGKNCIQFGQFKLTETPRMRGLLIHPEMLQCQTL